MIYSVNVKFDTSWENENKKSSKNPVNTMTDTCHSVFSNFEPILDKASYVHPNRKNGHWCIFIYFLTGYRLLIKMIIVKMLPYK